MSTRPEARVMALAALVERLGRDIPDHHSARRYIHAEVQKLHTSAAALCALRANPDPTATAAANTKRVMAAAGHLREQNKAVRERVNRYAQEGLRDIDRRIEAKVKLQPDAYAAEIRATFRTFPLERQHELLRQMVTENRAAELAAMVLAPEVCTGLKPQDAARYREEIVRLHAPDEHQESLDLMAAFETAMTAVPTAEQVALDHLDAAVLADIERAEAAAAKAHAVFREAVEV